MHVPKGAFAVLALGAALQQKLQSFASQLIAGRLLSTVASGPFAALRRTTTDSRGEKVFHGNFCLKLLILWLLPGLLCDDRAPPQPAVYTNLKWTTSQRKPFSV